MDARDTPDTRSRILSRRVRVASLGSALACALACGNRVGDDGDAAVDDGSSTGPGVGAQGGDSSSGGEPPLTCCGCLCADDHWSCSEDTCVTADAEVLSLAPEAGFFELDGGPYLSLGMPHVAPRHRVWYAFRPADDEPEQRPLVLFFNGGPGTATAPLFGFNTNAMTLDPQRTADDLVASNPASWTSFANVLYVDAPGTGFSYPLPLADGEMPVLTLDAERDAAAMIRVLLRFLARHPRIRDNDIILVGESYGGTRASLMLSQLLGYPTLQDGDYVDLPLHDEIVAHLAATLDPDEAPSTTAIARQFGRQVLIQPLVAGLAQHTAYPGHPLPSCVFASDLYQCDEPDGWLDDLTSRLGERMVVPAVLEVALGVDVRSIAWMHADARVGAYGRAAAGPEQEMESMFGALGSDDAYYVGFNAEAGGMLEGSRDWLGAGIADTFLRNVAQVRTFITDAPFDLILISADLPDALTDASDLATAITHDTAPRGNVARPGWLRVEFATGTVPVERAEIRFPRYPTAGHMVTLREPDELLADVRAWYEGE